MEVKISAKDVAALRKQTGAGMMDCKKALTEANGNVEEAIEILRKKGQKLSAKRQDRETNEGVVVVRANENKSKAVIVGLGCETDFVAINEDFQKFAAAIADIALEQFPASLEDLLALKFEGELSIGEKVIEQIGVIGEKVEVCNFATMEADQVVPYIHSNGKLGVLVAMSQTGDDAFNAGKDVAMQVAAYNPLGVDKDSVDQSVVDKEIEIGKEIARNEGKPEALLEKIAMGKLSKFFKENTLVNQVFVKAENKETVGQYLKSIHPDLKVKAFQRIQLGAK